MEVDQTGGRQRDGQDGKGRAEGLIGVILFVSHLHTIGQQAHRPDRGIQAHIGQGLRQRTRDAVVAADHPEVIAALPAHVIHGPVARQVEQGEAPGLGRVLGADVLDEMGFRQGMGVQGAEPVEGRLTVEALRLGRRPGPLRLGDEFPQLGQRAPDAGFLPVDVHAPDGGIRKATGPAFETAPVLVLSLPAAHPAQGQIELPGIVQHSRVALFDKLPTALGDLPVQEAAYSVDTPAHPRPCFEHGDRPAGAV